MSFAAGFRQPKVSLAGRAVREQTSDEVLSKAKQERTARKEERERQRAAATIGRWWRGGRARRATRQRLLSEWMQRYNGAVAQQQDALPAAELTGRMLPPVLLAYLGPAALQQHRAALLGGAALAPALLADSRALRGCFALLLRSLAAADVQHNLLGLAASHAAQEQLQQLQQRRLQLLSQLKRLLLLCCSLVGAAAADPLLQSAAARVAGILCDSALWKCFAAPQQPPQLQEPADAGRQWLLQQLHTWLAPLPLLQAAVGRLASRLLPRASADSSQAVQQQQQQQQQQLAVLNGLVIAQVKVWRQLSSLAGSGAADGAMSAQKQAAQQLLRILAVPGLVQLLTPAAAAQLAAAPCFTALLGEAAAWRPPQRGDALCLLGALAQLAAGKKALQREGRQVEYLPPSQLLHQEGVAAALGAAAVALLQPAAEGGPRGGGGTSSDAADGLWPFAEGTFAAQLLQRLPLPQLLRLYHSLLLLADGGGGKAPAARLLSALAFGTQLLPRLWRHLATHIGLPLEAPMQATRGWEVASLRRGAAGLAPEAAAQLGLFCRVYSHQLLVVDDAEFYERQQTFTLGQQRAIAATLNTLVFRTQLPDRGASARGASGGSHGTGGDHRMLQQAAPLLHRALYERDARRQFCPLSLWLEPYHHLAADGGLQRQPVSGAAVVRALLAAADDGEEGPDGRGPALPAAARAAAAAAAAASRPAAVAAILTAAPQCVPFEDRVAVFRALIDTDKERLGHHLAPIEGGARPLPLTIRRGYVLEDAAAQLSFLGAAAKSRLSITFINQLGHQEAGIDMGGLMKEFLESVVAEGFDPNRGLFSATPDGCAYPNPLAERLDGGLAALEALGWVLGRALYEGVLLDLPLAPFFVARLQGRWPLFEELAALDPEVYRSLLHLKRYDGPLADLCLDFTVESDFLGARVSEELVPGGSRIAVTNDNVLQYVYLVADWHLNKRLGPAANAFKRGLSQVIPSAWLRLFSPKEVNQLLGGGEAAALDVEDMQAHTRYSNGYGPSSTTIKHFWQVVRGMGLEEQRALLKFVTSCSRAPLGGFQHLSPPFTIHKVDCGASLLAAVGGRDVDRLPSSSTCHNTLKLPNFRRASTLRDKLLYAIKSGAGFEMS